MKNERAREIIWWHMLKEEISGTALRCCVAASWGKPETTCWVDIFASTLKKKSNVLQNIVHWNIITCILIGWLTVLVCIEHLPLCISEVVEMLAWLGKKAWMRWESTGWNTRNGQSEPQWLLWLQVRRERVNTDVVFIVNDKPGPVTLTLSL